MPEPVETIDAKLEEASRLFAQGKLGEAAALCDAVLTEAPGHPAALRRLAFIQVVQRNHQAAAKTLSDVAPHFPTDPTVTLALAETLWATQSAEAALPHLRQVVEMVPGNPQPRQRLAAALLETRLHDEAVAVLAPVLGPNADAQTLILAGRAAAATQQIDAAIRHFEAALRLRVGDAEVWFHLGMMQRAQNSIERAVATLTEAVRLAPANAPIRVALADALRAEGKLTIAIVQADEAVRLQPDWPVAWSIRGDIMSQSNRLEDAADSYRRALACPGCPIDVHALLGHMLHRLGRADEALPHYAASMAQASWDGGPSAPDQSRPRIGILSAPGASNTSTRFILDRDQVWAEIVYILPGYPYPPERMAASFDLLFNTISDADLAGPALGIAADLVAKLPAVPVINPPARIAETTREHMAGTLAGIAGAVVPVTRRCSSATLIAEAAALRTPLLIRPTGSHGGEAIVKLDNAIELAAYKPEAEGDFYLTRFVDFRSTDGQYRKYRLVFVEGEKFPYHLAIGDDWLVHYFRTNMAERADFREEEQDYLENVERHIGATAMAALDEIGRRVTLDFFGVDFGIMPSGELVLFECNATMLIRHIDEKAIYDYRKPAADRIRDAVTRLVIKRSKLPA